MLKFENESVEQINGYLEVYGLKAFEYRLINRILSIVGKIDSNSKSPSELNTVQLGTSCVIKQSI